MSILAKNDEFKILEEHEKCDIKFISALEVNKNAKIILEDVSLPDFKQGHIGNCALIAALAAMSQRPEFLSEICPKIEHTSEGVKLHFIMFYKGKPTIVTIDDKLPFINPSFFEWLFFGERPSLIYAKSANDDNFYLASLFEKAVVKLVGNNIYSNIKSISPQYVFSLFSDCMIGCFNLYKTYSKQNVIDHLKYEIDNNSSVVLGIKPDLRFKTEDIDKLGHGYVVMDYNVEHKAIKLYDPLVHTHCFLDYETNLPLSINETADPNKGERWITLDQLEKRNLSMNSLCSKSMYKSVLKINKTLKQITYDRDYSKVKFACKVDIKQASTFMINIYLFSHKAENFTLIVYTADNNKQNVKFNDKVSLLNPNKEQRKNGEAKSLYIQRFKLQPNKYIFHFEAKLKKQNTENVDFLLKIGSVSECSFEEIVEENKNCW